MRGNYLRKPSNLFWAISSSALVWNLMGVFNYLDQAFMTNKVLETLPKEQQILYQDVPAWVTAGFAIAVFSGTLGSLLLLLKKKIASTFFIISFLGIMGHMSYGLLIDQNSDSYGTMGVAMPIIMIVFGGYLIWYSRKANEHRWLS
jgi:hypothetical protein